MRNLICRWFGHGVARSPVKAGSLEGFGELKVVTISECGSALHKLGVHTTCPRCGEDFRVGSVAVPFKYIRALNRENIKEMWAKDNSKKKKNHETY